MEDVLDVIEGVDAGIEIPTTEDLGSAFGLDGVELSRRRRDAKLGRGPVGGFEVCDGVEGVDEGAGRVGSGIASRTGSEDNGAESTCGVATCTDTESCPILVGGEVIASEMDVFVEIGDVGTDVLTAEDAAVVVSVAEADDISTVSVLAVSVMEIDDISTGSGLAVSGTEVDDISTSSGWGSTDGC